MDAQRREQLRQQLEQIRQEIVGGGDEAIEPNRADGSTRTDEDAQPLNEMNQVIASRRNRVRAASLRHVIAALTRLRDAPEDFGLCVECEEEIAPKRLDLMPYAELCVRCQSQRDDKRGGRRSNLRDFVE